MPRGQNGRAEEEREMVWESGTTMKKGEGTCGITSKRHKCCSNTQDPSGPPGSRSGSEEILESKSSAPTDPIVEPSVSNKKSCIVGFFLRSCCFKRCKKTEPQHSARYRVAPILTVEHGCLALSLTIDKQQELTDKKDSKPTCTSQSESKR